MYESQFGSPDALNVATVTKLVRNMSMVLIIPLVSAWVQRTSGSATATVGTTAYLPLFIIGFLASVVARSVGDVGDQAFGLIDRDHWVVLIEGANNVAAAMLTVAMAGVGLSTSLSDARSLGLRPLVLAVTTAAVIAALAVASIRWLVGVQISV